MKLASGAICAATTLMLGFAASAAQADVLEVVPGIKAQWVSGPLVGSVGTGPNPEAEGALARNDAGGETSGMPDHATTVPALHARGIPSVYAAKVAELSERFDLSPALIEALVWQESRWRSDAVSPVGARGLAQLMPGTARELRVDSADPFANLEGGARYLRAQLDRFDGDLEKALAAYNAGPARVERAGGIPRIRETQTYVAAVMGRLSNHSRSPE